MFFFFFFFSFRSPSIIDNCSLRNKKKRKARTHPGIFLSLNKMATSNKNRLHGQIAIKGELPHFHGDEILHISVRDTLRHDAECIEMGYTNIRLRAGQQMPINYECSFDPDKAHMKFDQIKSIPGGVTLSARIERNEQLLYINDTSLSLADKVDIELVKVE
jgi:uncharacterized lipoprotein YbaY